MTVRAGFVQHMLAAMLYAGLSSNTRQGQACTDLVEVVATEPSVSGPSAALARGSNPSCRCWLSGMPSLRTNVGIEGCHTRLSPHSSALHASGDKCRALLARRTSPCGSRSGMVGSAPPPRAVPVPARTARAVIAMIGRDAVLRVAVGVLCTSSSTCSETGTQPSDALIMQLQMTAGQRGNAARKVRPCCAQVFCLGRGHNNCSASFVSNGDYLVRSVLNVH